MPDTTDQIIETLSQSKRVLVTTHVRPDGDALGSVAAMILGLKKKGIDAQALLLSHLPRKYAFIFNDYNIPFIDVENGWPEALRLEDFDTFLVVDTGTWSQLPGLQERIMNWRGMGESRLLQGCHHHGRKVEIGKYCRRWTDWLVHREGSSLGASWEDARLGGMNSLTVLVLEPIAYAI